jgi:hypothetical protein
MAGHGSSWAGLNAVGREASGKYRNSHLNGTYNLHENNPINTEIVKYFLCPKIDDNFDF